MEEKLNFPSYKPLPLEPSTMSMDEYLYFVLSMRHLFASSKVDGKPFKAAEMQPFYYIPFVIKK